MEVVTDTRMCRIHYKKQNVKKNRISDINWESEETRVGRGVIRAVMADAASVVVVRDYFLGLFFIYFIVTVALKLIQNVNLFKKLIYFQTWKRPVVMFALKKLMLHFINNASVICS